MGGEVAAFGRTRLAQEDRGLLRRDLSDWGAALRGNCGSRIIFEGCGAGAAMAVGAGLSGVGLVAGVVVLCEVLAPRTCEVAASCGAVFPRGWVPRDSGVCRAARTAASSEVDEGRWNSTTLSAAVSDLSRAATVGAGVESCCSAVSQMAVSRP